MLLVLYSRQTLILFYYKYSNATSMALTKAEVIYNLFTKAEVNCL